MDQRVTAAIAEQIQLEFHAAHQYLAMSTWFADRNLPGFQSWMRHQWEEEIVHALKFVDYMSERGQAPQLLSIGAPVHEFDTAIEVFEASLAHEQKVTASIYGLYELALECKDYPLQMLLQWFINEQLEEESNVGGVLDRLRLTEGSKSSLLLVDHELAARQGGEA